MPDPGRDPLLALRAGDPAPFEEFVRDRARDLVALFRRQGASLARAEDLTQEVFLKLYESAARYQPRERFQAYFHRVARNVWIDDCRRIAVRAGSAPDDERSREIERASVRHDPAAGLACAEEERGLVALLGELAPSHRRVFELVLLAELTYPEVAALLSIPLGTVKSRMFHAVRRLRAAWEVRQRREGVVA